MDADKLLQVLASRESELQAVHKSGLDQANRIAKLEIELQQIPSLKEEIATLRGLLDDYKNVAALIANLDAFADSFHIQAKTLEDGGDAKIIAYNIRTLADQLLTAVKLDPRPVRAA